MISPVDVLLFAPLAPLFGILLFWFLQLLFIESYKYFLQKIKRNHMPLCRFTNFIGILFQTLCHAMGFTVTRSGISQFKITVHYGQVKPKKEKTGIFEWVSNSFLFFGPFFIPSSLLALCLVFLLTPQSFALAPGSYDSFATGFITLGQNLHVFTQGFFSFLFNIDLLHPGQLGFFLLLLFLGLGIRPSYIGEDKRRKVDMIYDLHNIKSHLIGKPLYLVLLFLFAYVMFYISFLLNQNWYLLLFSVLGWISIIAIVALVVSHGIVFFIRITDKIPGHWRFLPFLIIPIIYTTIRTLFFVLQIQYEYEKTLALAATLLVTILVIFLLLRWKTNTFKSKTKNKPLRVKDGPRRIIEQ